MGNKKGEIKKSRDIFRVKGGMIICGLASFFTFSESRKPETTQFLIVNMGANNGCSFKLLTPCRFRTSSSSNELKYEFQPTSSINAPYDPVDHGSAPKNNEFYLCISFIRCMLNREISTCKYLARAVYTSNTY